MITLLHGDNIEASRNEFNRLKQAAKGKEIRATDGRGLDATALTQALGSSSLFGGDVLVVVENLFSKLGKKTKLIEQLAVILASSAKDTDIILWEDKEIGATVIKSLGSWLKVVPFKIPSLIFQFLDGLRPQSAKTLLPLYQKLVETEPAELVFTMITKRLRQLLMVAGGETPEGLQGWQTAKLTIQAKFFTMDILDRMYKKLLDIEYSLKTGATPFTLVQLTEQFLIDL
jgi:DNA polymerase III delta subunit